MNRIKAGNANENASENNPTPATGRAAEVTPGGPTAAKLFEECKSACLTATRPKASDEEPKPRRRHKEGEGEAWAGRFQKRIAARIKQAFEIAANAATVMTAPECPSWLREFFESEADPDNPLDPCNPDRDLVLGTSDGMVFEASYDITGPSLDLG